MENEFLELTFSADDVSTMKEKIADGTFRIRRWVKINVQEFLNFEELTKWTEVNPRQQDLKSKPAKAMRATLTGEIEDIFHFLNRGISISVGECTVSNNKDKKTVKIKLLDKSKHGVFDGAHSMGVLIQVLKKSEIVGEKHVMLEILEGVEDILFDLARSRNTSTQVKEKSLANLEGKFDFIKEALKNESFYNNIMWVENGDGEITINFIIQVLTAFNQNLQHKAMIKTYSGAGSCETAYIKEYDRTIKNKKDNNFYKMVPLYSDIFEFVDYVLVSLPKIHNKNGYYEGRGKFGGLKGVTKKVGYFPRLFAKQGGYMDYKIPHALYFPILAAMRQLYKEGDDGMYHWIIEPKKVFNEVGDNLVAKVMGCYFDKNGSVNEMGKSLNLWIDTYEIVRSYMKEYLYRLEIDNLKKQLATSGEQA